MPLGIAGGVWAYKISVAAASLGCVWLVWLLARELGRPQVPAIVLVGLNPLLLGYGVGGAHNDVYMLALVLGGVLLAVRGREALGAGAIVAGAAVKATGGLALPFLWLGARHRGAVVRGALIAAAGVLVVSAVAFGADLPRALAPFGEQASTTNVRSFPGQIADAFLGRDSVPSGIQAGAVALFVGARGARLPARATGRRLDRRHRVDDAGAAAHPDLGHAVVHRLAAALRGAEPPAAAARGHAGLRRLPARRAPAVSAELTLRVGLCGTNLVSFVPLVHRRKVP